MPPPFAAPVTPQARDAAGARLREIADAVFAPDLEQRALAKAWRADFESAIPRVLDWLEQRPAVTALEAEAELRREFAGTQLVGRADRIERHADGSRTVVDYKTGKLPKQEAVESGEAVQLLHYALLDPSIAAVEYLALREGQNGFGVAADLPALRDAAAARLDHALRRIREGAALPAHGHDEVCEYCDFAGLCRREDWHD